MSGRNASTIFNHWDDDAPAPTAKPTVAKVRDAPFAMQDGSGGCSNASPKADPSSLGEAREAYLHAKKLSAQFKGRNASGAGTMGGSSEPAKPRPASPRAKPAPWALAPDGDKAGGSMHSKRNENFSKDDGQAAYQESQAQMKRVRDRNGKSGNVVIG